MWPTDDVLLDAWRRLAADPDTAGAFAELVLRPLEADLVRQFPGVHPDQLTDAVDTAVLALVRNPAAYDPARGPLPGFLRMAARRDLANLLRAEGRHHRGRIPWEAVELGRPAGNDTPEADSLADHPELVAAVDGLDDADRRVLELMRDGERDTPVFAAALGIADRPPGEQAAAVKRAKDRVMARLKRAGRAS